MEDGNGVDATIETGGVGGKTTKGKGDDKQYLIKDKLQRARVEKGRLRCSRYDAKEVGKRPIGAAHILFLDLILGMCPIVCDL